jgi:hypothetical protein
MSMAEYDDLDDLDNGPDDQQRTPAEWAAKRRSDKAARDAKAEAEGLKRELAFTRAGLDPEKDPRLAYFIKGYEGEPTAEAVLAAAQKAGFVEPPQTGPTAEQQEALGVNGQIDAAAAGAAGPEIGDAAALQSLDEAYLAAGKEGVLAKLAEYGINPIID